MRLFEILNESTVEIDHERYEETEELISRVQSLNWKSLLKNSFIEHFNKLYPGVVPKITSTDDLRISTGAGDYYNNPNDEFIATILYPDAHISVDGKIYVGIVFDNIQSGKYKGIVSRVLNDVVPVIAKKVQGNPAIVIGVEDQSAGAWEQMARKLGWPYINETD